MTVPTTKLDDRSHAVLTDECVEEGGLSLGESTVRAHATGPAAHIVLLPERRGSAETDPLAQQGQLPPARERAHHILYRHPGPPSRSFRVPTQTLARAATARPAPAPRSGNN